VHGQSLPQFACASKLRISPGSHSAVTSNGRQQISQSVVNRWNGVDVSIAISNTCPQNGHWMDSEISTNQFTAVRCICKIAFQRGLVLIMFMGSFFNRNIDFYGRLGRGILGAILLIAGIIAADFELWVAIPLVVVGLFGIFEAVQGWCLLRACGIRTRR
jgi:hypothetical protein